ncbi:MAG TPA: PorV/PorQ family protein [Bacteroidota bacterium]|nr:PorV/PorQ family protein [Bacteroidota bacterium]
MLKTYFIVFLFVTTVSSPLAAQLEGEPGAFARLGFGARGMGMGNAMTAVNEGEFSSFYNPAATPFLANRVASLSYGLLSLDRSLNTLSYSQALKPTAGFSFGILNAGVRNIDGRDADGFQTGEYYTSENQFSFSFANKMSRSFSLGIGLKLYYYRLFEKVSSTSLGIDIGALFRLTDELTLGAVVQDLNAKYKWDTSTIYGEQGSSTVEPFPVLRKLGLSYKFADRSSLLSLEVESSNQGTTIIRMGGEAWLADQFAVRAGLDHWDTKIPSQASPTFGFTLQLSTNPFIPTLNYAYVIEPYGLFAMNILSLSSRF